MIIFLARHRYSINRRGDLFYPVHWDYWPTSFSLFKRWSLLIHLCFTFKRHIEIWVALIWSISPGDPNNLSIHWCNARIFFSSLSMLIMTGNNRFNQHVLNWKNRSLLMKCFLSISIWICWENRHDENEEYLRMYLYEKDSHSSSAKINKITPNHDDDDDDDERMNKRELN